MGACDELEPYHSLGARNLNESRVEGEAIMSRVLNCGPTIVGPTNLPGDFRLSKKKKKSTSFFCWTVIGSHMLTCFQKILMLSY